MAKTIYDTDLSDLVPQNLLEFKEISDICKALKLSLTDVTGSIYLDAIVAEFDRLPEDVIDLLAWQWHVDYYDSTADVETKRQYVRSSLEIHRHKGTKYAVNKAMSDINSKYHIREWTEYGGKPYYFRIVEPDGDMVSYSEKDIIKAAKDAKNVRSWLEGVQVETLQTYRLEHSADIRLSMECEQGYWVDSTFINLYWNGYHDNTETGERHTHYFNGDLEHSGREWMEIRGNTQKHKAEIIQLVEPDMGFGVTRKGYKFNSHFTLGSNIRYNSPKYIQYLHTAECITTKGGISTREAV